MPEVCEPSNRKLYELSTEFKPALDPTPPVFSGRQKEKSPENSC